MELLAAVDPESAIEYLEQNELDPVVTNTSQMHIVKSLPVSQLDIGIELADSVTDAESIFRSRLLRELLRSLPVDDPRSKVVEENLISTIRAIAQPNSRLAIWFSLAEYYQLTDRTESVQKIVEANAEDVQQLPAAGFSGYIRSLFAALIVNDDFELARSLIEGVENHELNRAIARLAFHCCESHPQRAIELLESMEPIENQINVHAQAIKVVGRMAGVHTDVALELAASIEEPNQRAWAYGMIARELIPSDLPTAQRALKLARQTLNEPSQQQKLSYFTASTTMAGLIPVAEQIAPGEVEELVWNVVWLAIPRSRWSGGTSSNQLRIQNSAAALARYDMAIARALLQQRDPAGQVEQVRSWINQLVFDPTAIEDLIARPSRTNRPQTRTIKLLKSESSEFWDIASLPEFMNWPTKRFEDF